MKKILVALDYDPLAEKVAETAHAIAKAMGAELRLLHVVMEPGYYSSVAYSPIMGFSGFGGMGDTDTIEMAHDMKRQAYNFLEESRKHLGDENIQVIAVEGDFADEIIREANEYRADLIVMGTHHRSGLDKLLLGNLTENILNNTNIPVLAVPAADRKQ